MDWGLFNSQYDKVVFTEGHDDGWEHYTIHFRDKKISVIVMANS